jgi:replication initiation and membrane attachment protein
MKPFWNELQPVDEYSVKLSGILHDTDRKILTFLYQPLIGSTCFSLYMTLWAQAEENRLWSKTFSHYSLMNFLNMNLKTIYQERLKLEGIGLLKTYVKESGDSRSYIYELLPPLTPEQFFQDGMLNVFLYRKIGRSQFLRLKRFFSNEAIEHESYKEVTRSWPEVFSSSPSALIDTEALSNSQNERGKEFLKRSKNPGLTLDEEQFDFHLLESGLKSVMVPKQTLTPLVRETILKLSYLYGINELDMKNILLTALDENDEVDIERLRKTARDWYQLKVDPELPELVDLVQPPLLRSDTKGDSPEDELIDYLETTSPRQLLIDISGSMPSKADLQAIEEIMFQQKLSPGVINVLIQYVMLKTDMKLSKSYLEKVAAHWARKKIKTVKEAMELAKKEHRQYLEWANQKKAARNMKKKPVRTEKLPDWFKEYEAKKSASKAENDDDFDFEAEKRKLEEKLKKRRTAGGEHE